MIKGYILNNTGRAKHIFQRTVYPGQKLDLTIVDQVVGNSLPAEKSLLEYLQEHLPAGWEVEIEETEEDTLAPSVVYVRQAAEKTAPSLVREDERHQLSGADDDSPSLEFAPRKKIDKLTHRDIFNLRTKDNPVRVIKQIDSVHKLRRALAMCKGASGKKMLANIIRQRIREIGTAE